MRREKKAAGQRALTPRSRSVKAGLNSSAMHLALPVYLSPQGLEASVMRHRPAAA